MSFEPFEDEAVAEGYRFIVGCDEAGRGPLAGPVVAAACYLPHHVEIAGISDSKCLSELKRRDVFNALVSCEEVVYGVGVVSAETIDQINILQASLQAMKIAVKQILLPIDYVFVDGPHCFASKIPVHPVIKGDRRVRSIAAASIIAKVTRDDMMIALGKKCPGYGFEKHKGYGVRQHLEALKTLGPTKYHRMSFAPLRKD